MHYCFCNCINLYCHFWCFLLNIFFFSGPKLLTVVWFNKNASQYNVISIKTILNKINNNNLFFLKSIVKYMCLWMQIKWVLLLWLLWAACDQISLQYWIPNNTIKYLNHQAICWFYQEENKQEIHNKSIMKVQRNSALEMAFKEGQSKWETLCKNNIPIYHNHRHCYLDEMRFPPVSQRLCHQNKEINQFRQK